MNRIDEIISTVTDLSMAAAAWCVALLLIA